MKYYSICYPDEHNNHIEETLSEQDILDFYCYSCYDEGEIPSQDESGYFICPDCSDTEDILDKLTQDNEDTGVV